MLESMMLADAIALGGLTKQEEGCGLLHFLPTVGYWSSQLIIAQVTSGRGGQ